ncbi:MAG: DUF2934 domain-containing protein [Planctomycetales bacterium]|nr:DUF2934 domain-containing protein [Planctomycetales bacterium]
MCPSLDSLPLSACGLETAKEQIRKLAYAKWQAAGCPAEHDDGFWQAAEREWIEFHYVPERFDNGACDNGDE